MPNRYRCGLLLNWTVDGSFTTHLVRLTTISGNLVVERFTDATAPRLPATTRLHGGCLPPTACHISAALPFAFLDLNALLLLPLFFSRSSTNIAAPADHAACSPTAVLPTTAASTPAHLLYYWAPLALPQHTIPPVVYHLLRTFTGYAYALTRLPVSLRFDIQLATRTVS